MDKETILKNLNDLFIEMFDDETIVLKYETVAGDVTGWDSLMHVNLIMAIEDEFNIKFDLQEMSSFHNIGELVTLIYDKIKPTVC